MKSLIVKELREQMKVALMGLVVLALMVLLSFASYGTSLRNLSAYVGSGSADSLQPLMKMDFLVQVSFFCGLFGALLGWLQIHGERHPDLWAFLVHRPVPRVRILRSKVVAGGILYILGAGLPLLSLILVASIPGHVAAPFQWGMALPLVSIFLVGILFYLAGLLTGMRKARWYGSRGFGLGVAFISNSLLFVVPEFWLALILIVAAGVILWLAVAGSFQTGGYYHGQSTAGKISMVLASTATAAVLLGAFVGFSLNLMLARHDSTATYHRISNDGTVLRVTQRGYEDADIEDLNGLPVLDPRTGRKVPLKDFQPRFAAALAVRADAEEQTRRNMIQQGAFFRVTRFFSPWTIQDRTIWYMRADGRLVGYQTSDRRLVGEIAPSGAGDDSRFLLPGGYSFAYLNAYDQPQALASARTLYRVDLRSRELKPIFTVTNGDPIGGFAAGGLAFRPPMNDYHFVLSRNAIRLVQIDGKLLFEVPYSPSARDYPMVSAHFLERSNTFALRFDPDPVRNKEAGGKLLSRVAWLKDGGLIDHVTELPKLADAPGESLLERAAILLVPPVLGFWGWSEWEPSDRLIHALRFVLSAVCTGVGLWLGRRYHFELKSSVGWGIYLFLFGLPGLLAFLAVQEWPARERCPSCKKLRVVDREECEHCGAAFAPPEKSGIEIFEPLAVE